MVNKIRGKIRTKKQNHNVILNVKRTRKQNYKKYNRGEDLEHQMFGGGPKWQTFKKEFPLFGRLYKKPVFYAKMIKIYKEQLNKLKDKLMNEIIILNNAVTTRIFKHLIRIFELIKRTDVGPDKDDKYINKLMKYTFKARAKFWLRAFGVKLQRSSLFNLKHKDDKERHKIGADYSISRKRDVLNLSCPRVVLTEYRQKIECNIRRFRKLEMKYNRLQNKFEYYYNTYKALFSPRYTKIVQTVTKSGSLDVKLSKKAQQIIDKSQKYVSDITTLDSKLKTILSEAEKFRSELEKFYKTNYPSYGFDQMPRMIGLQYGWRLKFFGWAAFSDKAEKAKKSKLKAVYKDQKVQIFIAELLGKFDRITKLVAGMYAYTDPNKDVTTPVNIAGVGGKGSSKSMHLNEIRTEIHTIMVDLISISVDDYRRVVRRDLGALTVVEKSESAKSLSKELKINRQLKLPVFVERMINTYMSEIKSYSYKSGKNTPNVSSLQKLKLDRKEFLFSKKSLGLSYDPTAEKEIVKEFQVLDSSFYAMLYDNQIYSTQDILLGTLLYILKQQKKLEGDDPAKSAYLDGIMTNLDKTFGKLKIQNERKSAMKQSLQLVAILEYQIYMLNLTIDKFSILRLIRKNIVASGGGVAELPEEIENLEKLVRMVHVVNGNISDELMSNDFTFKDVITVSNSAKLATVLDSFKETLKGDPDDKNIFNTILGDGSSSKIGELDTKETAMKPFTIAQIYEGTNVLTKKRPVLQSGMPVGFYNKYRLGKIVIHKDYAEDGKFGKGNDLWAIITHFGGVFRSSKLNISMKHLDSGNVINDPDFNNEKALKIDCAENKINMRNIMNELIKSDNFKDKGIKDIERIIFNKDPCNKSDNEWLQNFFNTSENPFLSLTNDAAPHVINIHLAVESSDGLKKLKALLYKNKIFDTVLGEMDIHTKIMDKIYTLNNPPSDLYTQSSENIEPVFAKTIKYKDGTSEKTINNVYMYYYNGTEIVYREKDSNTKGKIKNTEIIKINDKVDLTNLITKLESNRSLFWDNVETFSGGARKARSLKKRYIKKTPSKVIQRSPKASRKSGKMSLKKC